MYRAILDPTRTAAEVEAIQEILGLPAGAHLLDIGSGWGRHAIALAERGFRVTGLDQSEFLLDEARRVADEAGVDVRWTRADMRENPFESEFDAALSLFSSLGYFSDDRDDVRVLAGAHRSVKPGGLLLVETMHRDLIAREFAERDWWETPDGDLIRVEREFDPVAGVSRETLYWTDAEGATGEKSHTIRVRSATEWRDLLARAGWEPIDWIGGWELEPFTHLSERLIIVARR